MQFISTSLYRGIVLLENKIYRLSLNQLLTKHLENPHLHNKALASSQALSQRTRTIMVEGEETTVADAGSRQLEYVSFKNKNVGMVPGDFYFGCVVFKRLLKRAGKTTANFD